jgi:hypothetical protein
MMPVIVRFVAAWIRVAAPSHLCVVHWGASRGRSDEGVNDDAIVFTEVAIKSAVLGQKLDFLDP